MLATTQNKTQGNNEENTQENNEENNEANTQGNTEAKKQLRKQLLEQRNLAARRYRSDARAQQKMLDLFRQFLLRQFANNPPSPCSGYLPIRNEIDPRPLMVELRSQHKTALLLPVVAEANKPLVFRAFDGDEETLQQGPFATKHPHESAREDTPVFMLVPLLGFDRGCRRLGYGGGFYDRTLEALADKGQHPLTLGIAFEAQRRENLPTEPHDRPLDAVLSETTLYRRE